MSREKCWQKAFGVIGALIVSTPFASAEDLDAVLSFEAGQEESLPSGWIGGPKSTLSFIKVMQPDGSSEPVANRAGFHR